MVSIMQHTILQRFIDSSGPALRALAVAAAVASCAGAPARSADDAEHPRGATLEPGPSAAGASSGDDAAPLAPEGTSGELGSAPAGRAASGAQVEPGRGDAAGARDVVSFLEVGRGDRIADIGAGSGYSLEPLLEAVGPAGVLYVRRDPRPLSDLPSDTADAATTAPLPANLVVMNSSEQAPFAVAAKNLDLVIYFFDYHVAVAEQRDRGALHAAVFKALAPGRLYVVADHAAPAGSGLAAARTLGRIEESIVRREVEAAGFVFVESADFSSKLARAGRSASGAAEQFLLKFRKP